MTKKLLRRIAAIVLTVILVAGTMVTASAETPQYVPYESYTYWADISGSGRKLVYNRPMYDTQAVLDASDIGVDNIAELIDVCTDKDGNIYLLDTGSNTSNAKIIMLDSNYKLIKQLDAVYKDVPQQPSGENAIQPRAEKQAIFFTGARNIYVHRDKTIYICDTENNRVLQCDINGNYIDEYTLPDSPLIPEEFIYRPVKVVADSRGYVYILSEGSYYGALLYAPADSGTAKEFIGFYGANTVVNGILGALQSVLNRMFPNNERAANSEKALPFTFSDIVITDKDFIYTATDSAKTGQIKKLNPGAGNNILESDEENFVDDDVNRRLMYQMGTKFAQMITGLEVDKNEFIYALDQVYGRIFVYDSECRMLTAFGGGMGMGTQKGTFQTASAIALKETYDGDGKLETNEILIADKTSNTLTVFRRNDYGNMVIELDKMTIDGDYIESRDGWFEVLKRDKNLQVAYTGLARAYLAEDKYEEAMEMALEGYDRETYALAYEYQRQNIISENFTWVFITVAVLAIALAVFLIIRKRKGIVSVSKDTETRLALRVLLHPGLAFEEIKDKNRGSIRVSLVILLIFYVTAVLKVLWGGFLFTAYDPGSFNSLWVLVQSAGLIVLWVVANWLVTTLSGGKGKMKEIFIISCYSITPIIIERIIYIVLTNFMLPTEASFLGILSTIAMIYTGLLLAIGMMRIHDFTFTRFAGTTILTVAGMAAIVFLMILVGILLQQLGGFVSTVIIELLM